MRRHVIVPIVEGHGEVEAAPILIRRWLRHRNFHRSFDVHVEGPVRASGKGALKVAHDEADELGVEHDVEIALLRRPDVILVILDADDDCPRVLGPALLARVRQVVPLDYPIGVVVANREYEAWFLAAFSNKHFRESLLEQGFVPDQPRLPRGTDIEGVGDCKGYLTRLLGLKKYEPTIHQPKLTAILPFKGGMAERSRSFRKLLHELDSLMSQARQRTS